MSNLALFGEARDAAPSLDPAGNAGLYWAKFFDQWQPDFEGVIPPRDGNDGGKLVWLKRFGGSKRGDQSALDEAGRRLAERLRAFGRKPIELALASPFVTGTGLEHPVENGFAWHHTLGVPYLAGSGVKGLLRAYAEQIVAPAPAKVDLLRIFGTTEGHQGVGSVICLDALPTAPVPLTIEIMTPHLGQWLLTDTPAAHPPADWIDPNPIPFLAVDRGASFAFGFLPNPDPRRAVTCEQAAADCDRVEAWLKDALAWLGAGAKTAVGFGRFGAPEAVREAMKSETDRRPAAGNPAPIPRSSAAPRPADVLDPAYRFRPGQQVSHHGETGTVIGPEDGRLLVDFGDGPELVDPKDVMAG
jgi:CRISPR-associated protein Cmr6